MVSAFLPALWYGAAVFGMGVAGIFIAAVPADWMTLGGAGFMAVCVFVYSLFNPA